MSSLYEFTVQPNLEGESAVTYRYTSAGRDFTISSNTYTAIAIERSEIYLDLLQNSLTIKMQSDQEPVNRFKLATINNRIKVTVKLLSSGNPVVYCGYVFSTNYEIKSDQIVLRCKRFGRTESSTIRRNIDVNCSHSWAGAFTKANPSSGGNLSATINNAVTTGGTGFASLSVNDYISVKGKIYRVRSYDSSSGVLSFYPKAIETYSSEAWYNVTSLVGCPVNREEYKYTATLDSDWSFGNDSYGSTRVLAYGGSDASLLTLFATNSGDNEPEYKLGEVLFRDSSNNVLETGTIVSVATSSVTFKNPVIKYATVDNIIVYAGCTKRHSSCKKKFGSAPFYGGFPYINRMSRVDSVEDRTGLAVQQVPELFGIKYLEPIYVNSLLEKEIFVEHPSTSSINLSNTPKPNSQTTKLRYEANLVGVLCREADYLFDMGLPFARPFSTLSKTSYKKTAVEADAYKIPAFDDTLTSGGYFPDSTSQRNTVVKQLDNGQTPSISPEFKGLKFPVQTGEIFYTGLLQQEPVKDYAYIVNGLLDKYQGRPYENPDPATQSETEVKNIDLGLGDTHKITGFTQKYNDFFQEMYFFNGKKMGYFPYWISEYYHNSEGMNNRPDFNDFTEVQYNGVCHISFGSIISQPFEFLHRHSNGAITRLQYEAPLSEPDISVDNGEKNSFRPQFQLGHFPKIGTTPYSRDVVVGDVYANYQKADVTSGSYTFSFNTQNFSGTVSASDADNLGYITGSGTTFTDLELGMLLKIGTSRQARVIAIHDDTNMTVIPLNYSATFSGQSFGLSVVGEDDLDSPLAFIIDKDLGGGSTEKHSYVMTKNVNSSSNVSIHAPIVQTASNVDVGLGSILGANPSNVLYYILTEILEVDTAEIDETSFTDARNKLYEDKLGINLTISTYSEVKTVIKEILSYIDGVIYFDTSEGKFKLGLIRDANYGSQTLNSVAKIYSTSNSRKFNLEVPAYDSLYSVVRLTWSSDSEITPDNQVPNKQYVYELCNEVTQEVLSAKKTKEIKNRFITDYTSAANYMSRYYNLYTEINPKISLEVPVSDLDTIHEGCLIAYTDSVSPLVMKKIRVDKIAGFNEFSGHVRIECSIDYRMAGNYLPIPTGEWLPDAENIGELNAFELVSPATCPYFPSMAARETSTELTESSSTIIALTNWFDSSGTVEKADVRESDKNFAYKGFGLDNCILGKVNADYGPTGFIDDSDTGIVVDVPKGHNKISPLDSLEFAGTAIITTFDASSGTTLKSDIEYIAFKKLTVITQPTSTTAGQFRLTKISRNLGGNNYYTNDSPTTYPYASPSHYVSGKTNVTGQFGHPANSRIWVVSNLINRRVLADRTTLVASSVANTVTVTKYARSLSKFGNGLRVIQEDYTTYNPSVANTNNTTPPFSHKPDYPPQPASLYGYYPSGQNSGQQRHFVLYWAAANDRSGCGEFNVNGVNTNVGPDKITYIEWEDSETLRFNTIKVMPDQDFFQEMTRKYPTNGGDFKNDPVHTPDGAVAGYLNILDYYGSNSSTAGTDETVVTVESDVVLVMRNTGSSWPGLNIPIYDAVDKDSNRIVTGYGMAVITMADTATSFYVSHARLDRPFIKSARRKISLSSSDTTLKVT